MTKKDLKRKKIKIALIGFGNVGSQVYELITKRMDSILKETGCEIIISYVVDPDKRKTTSLPATIIRKKLPDIDKVDIAIVVSAGIQPSLEAILYFLKKQCPVVTSSRDALISHIEEIYNTAESNKADIYFEATVGGETPILEPIRRGFAPLGIDEICGIVHGSTNYILTSMSERLKSIGELSKEAFEKGFSPTGTPASIGGKGTTSKMVILAGLAFGRWVDEKKVESKGIAEIQISDIAYAESFGYQIRHIGIAKKLEQGILICAQPMLIPKTSILAGVKEENNLIIIKGKDIGEVVFQGSGAGGRPTAVSVVCDVMEIVRNLSQGIKKRYPYIYHRDVIVSSQEQNYPFYLRFISGDIDKSEKTLRETFNQSNVKIMQFIKNKENEGGEIVLLTSIVKEETFINAINNLQESSQKVECIKYLPILLQ